VARGDDGDGGVGGTPPARPVARDDRPASQTLKTGVSEPMAMEEFVFTCPECGQRIELNRPMREATLTNGCPVCGATVDADSFARA
jgi:predicted RNA-binding Zn-ribbon protein involved in translation (DUF1610 family)